MTEVMREPDPVREYYTALRPSGETVKTIYGIWEAGGAFNDSVTPSTHVSEYRSHIVLKILSLTGEKANVFSLGCGNGFVEADLVGHDRVVRAVDYNAEAVELTRGKGVDAFVADFFLLGAEEFVDSDVVYADGLLGHLFDPSLGVDPALRKLGSVNLKPGAFVVLSNDSPLEPGVPFAPHERVEGFWFVSREYLRDSLERNGFEPVEDYYFPYRRPLSGLRNRTICVARVP